MAGTSTYGLKFLMNTPVTANNMRASIDADLGGCQGPRRETTGFIFAVNATPIYWKSKRQTTTSLSSCEAEYVALLECAKVVTRYRKLK